MQQQTKKIKLRQLNIAVLGPSKHGKSSLVKWLTGNQGEDPMGYKSSMKRQHHYIYHRKYHINLFDLPADDDYVTISNTQTITNIIFVVSANPVDFNDASHSIQNILRRCQLLNVKRILFAVNFMDSFPNCNWKMDAFQSIVVQLKEMCTTIQYKKEPLQTTFVPTSALLGENILKKSALEILIEHGVCQWVKQNSIPCVLEAIETLMISQGKTKTQRQQKFEQKKKPLRLTVIGRIPLYNNEDDIELDDVELDGSEDQPVKGIFAYIHSGKLRRNTNIIIQPSQTFAVVKRIEYFTAEQAVTQKRVQHLFEDQEETLTPTHASAGSLCYIYFHNEERLKIPLGSIAGEPEIKKIPREVDYILCKIKLTGSANTLINSHKYEGLCGMQRFIVQVQEIQGIYDTKMGRLIQMNSGDKIKQADNHKLIYQMRLLLLKSACIERYQQIPNCGQVFLFKDSALVAMCRVDEITLKQNSIDFLPRVFAVPRQQLLCENNKEYRSDWDVCQIDLNNAQDTLLLPCGHLKLCGSCSHKMNRCPFCKLAISKRIKMQVIMMEENVDLMEFALCDQCVKGRITHAVMDCDHYKCLCQDCIDKLKINQNCDLCNRVHLISKIYI